MWMSARRGPIHSERGARQSHPRPTLHEDEGVRLRRDVRRLLHRTARHPDRVGLAAGYWRRSFGRDRRDCLGADELSHCRNHRDSSVRVDVARYVDPLAVLCVGGWLYRGEPVVWSGLGHSQHDRVSRSAGLSRRLDDSNGLYDGIHLLLRPSARDRRGHRRRHIVSGSHVGTHSGRLDHRSLFVALAILHQPGPGNFCLGCLEYTLEEGARWDWLSDDTIRTTAWIAALAGVGFIWRSLSHPQPIVDFSALRIRNFGLGSLFSFVSGIAIFTTIYLTPLFLGRVRGFSALQIGCAVF